MEEMSISGVGMIDIIKYSFVDSSSYVTFYNNTTLHISIAITPEIGAIIHHTPDLNITYEDKPWKEVHSWKRLLYQIL